MQPSSDPSTVEPWVLRIVEATQPQERDRVLVAATEALGGPCVLWREDEATRWHPVSGSGAFDLQASQLAAIAAGELAAELPLAHVLIQGEAGARRALVVGPDADADVLEALLVLAAICEEQSSAPQPLVDLLQAPLPSETDEAPAPIEGELEAERE